MDKIQEQFVILIKHIELMETISEPLTKYTVKSTIEKIEKKLGKSIDDWNTTVETSLNSIQQYVSEWGEIDCTTMTMEDRYHYGNAVSVYQNKILIASRKCKNENTMQLGNLLRDRRIVAEQLLHKIIYRACRCFQQKLDESGNTLLNNIIQFENFQEENSFKIFGHVYQELLNHLNSNSNSKDQNIKCFMKLLAVGAEAAGRLDQVGLQRKASEVRKQEV